MRKSYLAILVIVSSLLGTTPSARAEEREKLPQVPFVFTNASLSWPCAPQAIYIDRDKAPSQEQIKIVTEAIAEFSRASKRSWPVTNDPSAPVVITWTPEVVGGMLTTTGADEVYYRGATTRIDVHEGVSALYKDIRHELAHVAGLGHVEWTGSIMGDSGGTDYGASDLIGLAISDWRCRRQQHPGYGAGLRPGSALGASTY